MVQEENTIVIQYETKKQSGPVRQSRPQDSAFSSRFLIIRTRLAERRIELEG